MHSTVTVTLEAKDKGRERNNPIGKNNHKVRVHMT